MKKTIKKILTIACSLVLCLVCLTGCSWLDIDRFKYYNAVVVSVGDKDFYKKDLIEAFSNYGYQYYESYGMSLEESVNSTISSMIDRYLLLETIKADEKYDISLEESNKIKQQAFNYMRDSVYSYETKIRKEWGKEIVSDTSSSTDTDSLRDAEETYTPSTVYEYVEKDVSGVTKTVLEVTRNETEEDEETVILDDDISDPNVHFDKSRLKATDQKIADEAWTRYVKSLQDGAKGEGRSTDEKAVLLHEENRLIELLTNNLLLEKYEDDFYSGYSVNVDAVIDYYKNNYKAQKSKYDKSITQYRSDMNENASSTLFYYHPNSGNEFVNVKHILINFSDLQKDQISQLKSDYGISDDTAEATLRDSDKEADKTKYAEYKAKLDSIVKQTKTTFDINALCELDSAFASNKDTETWSALDQGDGKYSVYDFVRDYVAGGGNKLASKCDRFNDLVYIFNDDSGFMNSEFDYVVNLDTNTTDQMVKPFADGVRALENTSYGIGALEDKTDAGAGEGAISYIISTYGIHIIFHAGTAKNIVNSVEDFNNREEILKKLCTTNTTPESNKSLFNYIYDKLSLESSAYDNKTSQDVKTARTKLKQEDVTITYYKNNYKDLWS